MKVKNKKTGKVYIVTRSSEVMGLYELKSEDGQETLTLGNLPTGMFESDYEVLGNEND